MGEGSAVAVSPGSFPRIDEIPGFRTLPLDMQYGFVRQHHAEMLRALDAHERATNQFDRDTAIEVCRVASNALRIEVELAIRKRQVRKDEDVHDAQPLATET